MRALVASVALAWGAACADWPDLSPHERDVELDPRLGREVFRTDLGLRIASLHQADGLWLVFEEIGVGWQARRVEPGGAIEALPPPPLRADERIAMGRGDGVGGADRVVIATARSGAVEVHRLGDAWETLPAVPVTAAEGDLGAVIAHGGAVWIEVAGRLFVWEGAGWEEPVTGPGAMRLGGFDGGTQWVLVVGTTGFVAVPVASGVAGEAVPGPAARPEGSAINGDGAGFQVLAGGAMWRFDGAAFTEGVAIEGEAWAAPGSARVVVSSGGTGAAATWAIVDDAAAATPALAPFVPAIECACDAATDPACGCVPHTVGFVSLRPSPDAARMALTMADDVGGLAVLTARFLDLPFEGDPFAVRE